MVRVIGLTCFGFIQVVAYEVFMLFKNACLILFGLLSKMFSEVPVTEIDIFIERFIKGVMRLNEYQMKQLDAQRSSTKIFFETIPITILNALILFGTLNTPLAFKEDGAFFKAVV